MCSGNFHSGVRRWLKPGQLNSEAWKALISSLRTG